VTRLLIRARILLNRTKLAGLLECLSGHHMWVLVIPAPGEWWRLECSRCPASVPDDRVIRLPRWAR